MEDKVVALEVGQARLEERVALLEDWQEKQNGSLRRVEEKIDRFTWWLVLTLGGVVVQLVLTILRR